MGFFYIHYSINWYAYLRYELLGVGGDAVVYHRDLARKICRLKAALFHVPCELFAVIYRIVALIDKRIVMCRNAAIFYTHALTLPFYFGSQGE